MAFGEEGSTTEPAENEVPSNPHHVMLSKVQASESLPSAIWIPSGSYQIYRGSPADMVRQMAALPKKADVRPALRELTQAFAQSRRVVIALPWEQSDDLLAFLFVQRLLELGIGRRVPQA